MSQLVLTATSSVETNLVSTKTIVNVFPARGKSAYEIWLGQGYIGSASDFLTFLASGGQAPAFHVFRQADYMHLDDLNKIRSGILLGQDVNRITAGMRTLHEDALAHMLSANGSVAVISYEAGITAINRSVTSADFLQALWDSSDRTNSRMEITATGPVTWQLSGWQDLPAVRADGVYGVMGLGYAVPYAVFEWSQPTGFSYLARIDLDLTLRGEESEVTDPVGFRLYRLNNTQSSGVLEAENLRNTVVEVEACFNCRFDIFEGGQRCGWQPAEHGRAGLIPANWRYKNTGTEIQIVTLAGVPVTFFTAAHVGKRIALDRQGISAVDAEQEDAGRLCAKWFTISSVAPGGDASKAVLDSAPDYTSEADQWILDNRNFSFAAMRATTTAGSAVVTLSAPLADNLVGRTVTVMGAGYQDNLLQRVGKNLTSIVVSQTSTTLTLADEALEALTLTGLVVSPQIRFGTNGATAHDSDGHKLGSWRKNDDVHAMLRTENGAYGVVPLVMDFGTGITFRTGTKLHGCSTGVNNFGGNFANIVATRVRFKIDGKLTHSMHSPYFGKFCFSGPNVSAVLEGQLSAWTADTETALYYLDPDLENGDFKIMDALDDYNLVFPSAAAQQVLERGRGQWQPGQSVSFDEMVASPALHMRKSYTLREVVGQRYNQNYDAAAILNEALPNLALDGKVILNSEKIELSAQTKLFMPSGMDADMTGAVLWRDWGGTGANAVMITHENYLTGYIENATLKNLTIRTRDLTMTGPTFTFDVRNGLFEGIRVLDYTGGDAGGVAFGWGGEDVTLRNCYVRSADETSGDGAFRMLQGTRCMGIGLVGYSSDDVFQFVPNTGATPGSYRYGQGISYSQYVGCYGISRQGRLALASVAGLTGSNIPSTIKSVSFESIKGSAPGGLVVGCTIGDGTVDQVDDVAFAKCQMLGVLGGDTLYGTSAATVIGQAGVERPIGRVSFQDCSVDGAVKPTGLDIYSPGAIVAVDRCSFVAETFALRIRDAKRVSLNGGRYGVLPDGATDRSPIYMNPYAADATLHISGQPLFEGVPSNYGAMRAVTGKIFCDGAIATKQAGATNTSFVSIVSPAEVTLNRAGIMGDVDTMGAVGTGVIRMIDQVVPVRNSGVVSGIVSDMAAVMFSDINVLETEGLLASDNLSGLSVPADAVVGDIFRVRTNNSSRDVTILHNQTVTAPYYPIKTRSASSIVLSSNTQIVNLMWMGDHFQDLTWVAAGGGGGSSAWGGITGTLSDQTDLQSALDGKSSTSHGHASLPAMGIAAGTRRSLSSNTTLDLTDYMKTMSCTASLSLTLPTTPFTGFEFDVICSSGVTVTLVPGGADTIENDALVYPNEGSNFRFDGAAWRRRSWRGFGFRNPISPLMTDQSAIGIPPGLYQIGATTANIAKPSHMTGTILACRVEQTNNSLSRQIIWNPARPQDGIWSRSYVSSAWQTTWASAGSASVATADLPTNAQTGAEVYDTTLGTLVVWNGSTWESLSKVGHTHAFAELTGTPEIITRGRAFAIARGVF